MSFTRKYLSADGLHKKVKHCLLREQFKVMNSEYTWQDCIMSGLAVFGFKFPSLFKVLIVEDGLASNFPHLDHRLLEVVISLLKIESGKNTSLVESIGYKCSFDKKSAIPFGLNRGYY